MLRKLVRLPYKLYKLIYTDRRLQSLEVRLARLSELEDKLASVVATLKRVYDRSDSIDARLGCKPAKKIIVWATGFDTRVGGIVASHKLCHLLRQAGADSYLWMAPGGTSRNYYSSPIANGVLDPQQCCVIYPELVDGNPLGARQVVRWLLNTPGFFGVPFNPSADDVIATYAGYFSRQFPEALPLTVLEPYLDKFFDKGAPRRGTCYTVRKGFAKRRIAETAGQFEITHDMDFDAIAHAFQTHERFISYDSATFLSLHAALCGCVSTVIPDAGVARVDWLNGHPLFKHGVAYGLDDCDHAVATMHLVRESLIAAERESLNQVKRLLAVLDQQSSSPALSPTAGAGAMNATDLIESAMPSGMP